MVLLLEVADVARLVRRVGIKEFMKTLIFALEHNFANWQNFEKRPRDTFYFKEGVIETMPISDKDFYSVKLVNGHPLNSQKGQLTVAALGVLADVKSGYPLMLTESTLLTALRTGATTGLATKHLSRSDSKSLGIIGTGAQSEFQCLGVMAVRNIECIYYYDIDSKAIEKFVQNMNGFGVDLVECENAREVAENSDILITATANKGAQKVVHADGIKEGTHINAIGGDCPGKTELDHKILEHAKIIVEFLEQTKAEGEIQNLTDSKNIYAELWELANKSKIGRENSQELTIFDSVGFALEDWVTYRLIYRLANEYAVGKNINLIPQLRNVKNLFSVLSCAEDNNINVK